MSPMTQSDRAIPASGQCGQQLMTIASLERLSLLCVAVGVGRIRRARRSTRKTQTQARCRRRKFRPSSLIAKSATASPRKASTATTRSRGSQDSRSPISRTSCRVSSSTSGPTISCSMSAHVLSPAMIKALATDFHDLNPKPLGGGPKDLVPAGEKIFQAGIARRRCSAMRLLSRPRGQRQRPVSSARRSALSLSRGPIDELGTTSAARPIRIVMAPIAHSLTAPQVKAVAAYLSSWSNGRVRPQIVQAAERE